LIFEAAYGFDFDQLRMELLPLAALSTVALVVSTALIGYGLHWCFASSCCPSSSLGR
jgi:NhaP-type Na+/H+ or K+/H+ antiporter